MRALINEGLRQRQEHGAAAALPFFEKAAQIDPDSHLPFFMLGNAAAELGDLDAAAVHFLRARDLQPNECVIHFNLGLNQLARGYVVAGIEELRIACGLSPDYLPAHSAYLLALHNSDRIGQDEIAAISRDWGKRFARNHPAAAPAPPRADAEFPETLRVGFISGDFRVHSVAQFFEPVVSAHDRSAFEYVLYSNSNHRDETSDRLRSYADHWRDVWHISDETLIELIRGDRIDILVDLSGHTAGNRLGIFAHRAAPVQVAYLGYPDSTGLPTMDYRITDAASDPEPRADEWHVEHLLRMPGSQWCFRPYGAPIAPGALPARAAGYVTFGSFNHLAKISDTLLQCWLRILAGSPTSRLRLTRVRSPQRAAEIIALFASAGVAAERIECVAERSEPPHGLQFQGVDIALDPYPYNGVTTTCESLSAGVPVISLHATNGVSRSGLSLLGSLGLGELSAGSVDEYVAIALALAGDLERLERLRATLPARFEQSPLRDETGCAARFEELLHTAWQQYRTHRPLP